MIRQEDMQILQKQVQIRPPKWLYHVLWLFIAFGVVMFCVGKSGAHAQDVWQILLVNNLFFTSVALGGLALSVIFTITSAVWARPVKRMAEGLFAFAPVSFVLFIVLFFGASHFFEWIYPARVIAAKQGWLHFSFFVKRNIITYLVLLGFAFAYLYYSLRADAGLVAPEKRSWFMKLLSCSYGEQSDETQRSYCKMRRLAPICAIMYGLLTSLIAFDWIMSIDQAWFSTMFGVEYAVSGLVVAFASLMLIAGILKKTQNLSEYISTKRYHDMSKLSFASCLLWTYVIFAQILTIWYANLPEETPYLALRMLSYEWRIVFWIVAGTVVVIPFFGLLSRTTSQSVWFSRIIAIIIIIGMWLEKYLLVVPSIQENQAALGIGHKAIIGFSFNLYDFAITLGMLSLFILCFVYMMTKVPIMPIGDKLFSKDSKH